ncbi:helix-turn-helix domain-containing protein [uncultured Robinsoniella sp.]|uniref:helix-turn-helix domain-containing protein n=1 Tax=uncultured Robinsoniella sp. TaxID=904190 RepID=UPI00204E8CE2|nr:MAG TPA: helix-turn-helix domain protein [Caudoviricetes sp.]
MTRGERIKQLRKALGLSAEELGTLIGKTRATIYRYENGEIEDMPITILEPLAKALNTTPAFLMGWDEPTYYHKLGKIEALDTFKADGIAGTEVLDDSDELKILNIFRKFNSTGKLEATKRLEELSYIPLYCKKDSTETN